MRSSNDMSTIAVINKGAGEEECNRFSGDKTTKEDSQQEWKPTQSLMITKVGLGTDCNISYQCIIRRNVCRRARGGLMRLRQSASTCSFSRLSVNPTTTDKRRSSVASLIQNAMDISSSTASFSSDDESVLATETTCTSSCSIDASKICTTTRVRFDLARNDEVSADPTFELTEEIIQELWYTPNERSQLRANYDNALTVLCGKDKQDWLYRMNRVMLFCNQSPQSNRVDEVQQMASITTIMDHSKYRGLEGQGIPMLRSIKKKHMKNVLEYIPKVPDKLPEDLRARMISARSLQYSRSLAVLAGILGEADAEIAKTL